VVAVGENIDMTQLMEINADKIAALLLLRASLRKKSAPQDSSMNCPRPMCRVSSDVRIMVEVGTDRRDSKFLSVKMQRPHRLVQFK